MAIAAAVPLQAAKAEWHLASTPLWSDGSSVDEGPAVETIRCRTDRLSRRSLICANLKLPQSRSCTHAAQTALSLVALLFCGPVTPHPPLRACLLLRFLRGLCHLVQYFAAACQHEAESRPTKHYAQDAVRNMRLHNSHATAWPSFQRAGTTEHARCDSSGCLSVVGHRRSS